MRYPLCNNRRLTAPAVYGIHLPLCSRCIGLACGAAIGSLTTQYTSELNTLILLTTAIPCAIDGYRSYFGGGTTNGMRFITGAIAGLGAISLVARW